MIVQEKTQIRVNIATKAVIQALERYNEKNPGKCIVKADLFPNACRRAGWIMEDEYDPNFDLEAIAPPDMKFLANRWSDICLQAAEQFGKYIVWEPRVGVRLGTLKDYQAIVETTLPGIAQGLVDNGEKRAKVIIKQGGESILMTINIKRLTSGKKDNGENEKDLDKD